MTEIDQALSALELDRRNPDKQSRFYNLFLNTTFYVPTLEDEAETGATESAEKGPVLPLVIEAEGRDFLMLFDTQERLQAWAQAEADCVEVPGHVIVAMSEPPLNWALNIGSESSKLFSQEEIAWLKGVVAQCEDGKSTPQE